MQCDLCGANSALMDTIIEGAMLAVCKECSMHGVVVQKPVLTRPANSKLLLQPEQEMYSMVTGYGPLIKAAREKKELTHKQLAMALAEKESIIQKIESERMEPPLKLAKKMEQFLKVRLIAEQRTISQQPQDVDLKNSNLTIGDLLEFQKKPSKQ